MIDEDLSMVRETPLHGLYSQSNRLGLQFSEHLHGATTCDLSAYRISEFLEVARLLEPAICDALQELLRTSRDHTPRQKNDALGEFGRDSPQFCVEIEPRCTGHHEIAHDCIELFTGAQPIERCMAGGRHRHLVIARQQPLERAREYLFVIHD